MGSEVLEGILEELFDTNSILDEYMNMLDYHTIFNCLGEFKSQLGVDVEPVAGIIFAYAFYLLMLKMVWKCFNIYILNVDGDDSISPLTMVTNFAKAIVVSLSFGLLFSYMCNIGNEITGKILGKINVKVMTYSKSISLLKAMETIQYNLTLRLILGVFTILALILSVKFIVSAIQLVFLRVGIAFATVGLLDSDQGVFKPYIKKFFQIIFAVVVQVACFRCSLYAVSKASFIWAFALISMAMTAPAFLQEFIMTNQGGGGKIQQALYSFSIMRSFARR